MSAPSAISTAPQAQLPEPGAALALLAESTAHRSELAVLEFAEARDHALGSALLAGIVAVMGIFCAFALTLLAASLVWDSAHRDWWLAGLGGAYLTATIASGLALERRLRRWQPLEATRNQLHNDLQCLSNLIKAVMR